MRVRVSWGLPLEEKVLMEIGKVMVSILPFAETIEIADSEGVVIKLTEYADTEELEELKRTLKYVTLEIEESSPEE